MRIEVNGVRLFFDIEGAKFVPDGNTMREKPTLLLLHGGPGSDHSGFKPAFSQFADICQVVYLDHRANGRSDDGSMSDWNLAQWGDDVRAFCEALELEKPIVMGQSFGGFVAQSYATRHPDHPGKLIISSSSPTQRIDRILEVFSRLAGPKAVEAARDFWMNGATEESLPRYQAEAMAHYSRTPQDPDGRSRAVRKSQVLFHFSGPDSEQHRYNFLPDLHRIKCPTLILGGEDDPVCPIQDQEDIVAAMNPELVQFERFPSCGHGAYRDDPRVYSVIREFILT